MPSLKALRKRIATVRSTQQITKAMKLVSAAKLRRAQEAAERARPYAAKMAELFADVVADLEEVAHPLLARLAAEVPAKLGGKPALFVWGMKDFAFRPGPTIPRMRATFPDHVLVELPDAKHFIQEDSPDRVAAAIMERFG